MPKVAQNMPENLRPFQFHGVEFSLKVSSGHVTGDCPMCGRDDKFSIKLDTGQYKCFVCDAHGNSATFLQWLWDESDKATNGESDAFARERGLLYPDTLTHWGVVKSVLTGEWLVPGYNPEGKLTQLYKRIRVKDRWELRPTPTHSHAVHGLPLFDKKKGTIYLHESWGNALAFWEVARSAKSDGNGGFTQTGNEAASLLADANVLAVANCGAMGGPFERYLPLCQDKVVVLMFDNDHPPASGAEPAGLAATKRAAALLGGIAKEIKWLRWGKEGWEPNISSGYDVRDVLDSPTPSLRADHLKLVLDRIEPVPAEWVPATTPRDTAKPDQSLKPMPCSDWGELRTSWRKAMCWRQAMEDVLSVSLAICLSTEQVGDQLFLQMIGDAGSGKTRFCDAMLVSKACFALEHLTGFHSGWNDGTGEDYSLLARINRKTLITPEGDVLMSSPRFVEIMSQQRRIFDGTSGASYKNRKEDIKYEGLRTPWIMAGTPALLDTDQSRLGDRFLRVVVDPPSEDDRKAILRRVGFTALRTVVQQSNCKPESIVEENLLYAYQLTGGYVDWLRANASDLLSSVTMDEEWVVDKCSLYADFTADMRARPHRAKDGQDTHDTKELPTRLTHQFVRLAVCLAVVTGRMKIDAEVMRLVKKVALDTGRGMMLDAAKGLHKAGRVGASLDTLSIWAGHSQDKHIGILTFLQKMKVAEWVVIGQGLKTTKNLWRLTERFLALYKEVHDE